MKKQVEISNRDSNQKNKPYKKDHSQSSLFRNSKELKILNLTNFSQQFLKKAQLNGSNLRKKSSQQFSKSKIKDQKQVFLNTKTNLEFEDVGKSISKLASKRKISQNNKLKAQNDLHIDNQQQQSKQQSDYKAELKKLQDSLNSNYNNKFQLFLKNKYAKKKFQDKRQNTALISSSNQLVQNPNDDQLFCQDYQKKVVYTEPCNTEDGLNRKNIRKSNQNQSKYQYLRKPLKEVSFDKKKFQSRNYLPSQQPTS